MCELAKDVDQNCAWINGSMDVIQVVMVLYYMLVHFLRPSKGFKFYPAKFC